MCVEVCLRVQVLEVARLWRRKRRLWWWRTEAEEVVLTTIEEEITVIREIITCSLLTVVQRRVETLVLSGTW